MRSIKEKHLKRERQRRVTYFEGNFELGESERKGSFCLRVH